MKELTPNQKKSHDFSRNIVLSAGAGSGKTTVLISRIIHMLATIDGFRLTKLVAITFTTNAATEMKSRLRERLLDTENLPKGALKKRGEALADLSTMQISTFDSFFVRILRRYAIELHIDPDFTIITDSDDKVALFESIAKKHFNTLYKSDNNEFISLYKHLGEEQLLSLLRYSVEHPSPHTNPTQESLHTFWHELNTHYNDALLNEINADKSLTTAYLRAREARMLKGTSKNFDTLQGLLEGSLTAEKILPLYTALSTKGMLRAEYLKPEKFSNEDSSNFLILLDRLAFYAPRIMPNINENDELYFSLYATFHEVQGQILAEFEASKRKRGEFEFHDTRILIEELFANHPQAITELRRELHFFMVDEFQDTNFNQLRILMPLICSPKNSNILDTQRLFIVGDPKQAIYGFRGTDVAVFAHVQALVRESNEEHHQESQPFTELDFSKEIESTKTENLGLIYLQENFRTEKKKLAFMNALFEPIFAHQRSKYDVEFTPLLAGRKQYEDDPDKVPYFLNLGEKPSQRREAAYIASQIANEINTHNRKFSDIAILLRSRPTHTYLQEELQTRQIPFEISYNTSIFLTQAAFDIYNLIRYAAYPSDEIALFAVLRSPLFNLEHDKITALQNSGNTLVEGIQTQHPQIAAQLERLTKNSLTQPVLSWLKQTFREDNLRFRTSSELAEEYLDVTRALFLFLHDDRSLEKCDIYEFEHILNTKIQAESLLEAKESSGKNAVQIMTIHKSKGLEFDVVFLPFLNKKLAANVGGVAYFYKRDLGTFIKPFYSLSEDTRKNSGFVESFFKYDEFLKNYAEQKRLLYVAVTRAKKKLFLSSSHKTKDDSYTIEKSSFAAMMNIAFPEISEGKSSEWLDFNTDFEHVSPNYSLEHSSVDLKQFEPIEISSKKNAYSPTEIDVFLRDTLEYERKYLSGLFEEDLTHLYSESKKNELSGALFGSLVHEVLQYAHSEAETQHLIKESLQRNGIFSEKNCAQLNEHVLQFFRSEKTAFIRNAEQSYAEIGLQLPLGEDFLFGILDRVVYSDNKWSVVDYKTNNVTLDNFEEIANEKYSTQMSTYALLLQEALGQQSPITVQLYFTKIDAFYSREYSVDDCKSFAEELRQTIQKIKQFESQLKLTS